MCASGEPRLQLRNFSRRCLQALLQVSHCQAGRKRLLTSLTGLRPGQRSLHLPAAVPQRGAGGQQGATRLALPAACRQLRLRLPQRLAGLLGSALQVARQSGWLAGTGLRQQHRCNVFGIQAHQARQAAGRCCNCIGVRLHGTHGRGA